MTPANPLDHDVSVVMATFNGARFIEEQLRSIVEQTVLPRELVIGDDGSTDDTVDIVRRFARDAPMPIDVTVNNRNLGYGANFLRTASRANGRFIAFSDQDDVWYPEKIERSVAALGDPGVRLVAHQMNLIDQRGAFIRLDPHGTTRTVRTSAGHGDPFGVFFGFTMTFDRSLLELLPEDERGIDPFKPSMALAHDRWVYFLGTAFGDTVLLAEPLAGYRQHDTQSFGIIQMSRLDRARKKLADGRQQVRVLAEIALHRYTLIESHRPGSDVPMGPASAEQWRVATQRWRRISTYSERRARSYDAASFLARSAHLVANLVSGAYRSHAAGGLGSRHLAEDVAAGMLGPLLRRLRIAFREPAR